MSARGRFPSIEQWMLRRTCVTSWFHKVQRMIRPSPANRPALIENARWRYYALPVAMLQTVPDQSARHLRIKLYPGLGYSKSGYTLFYLNR